jgi:hypothetical protein
MPVMDYGAMRSGGGGAAGPGKATAMRLRPQLRRARLATSTPELSLAEEWTDPGRQTDSDRQAERC